MSAPETVGSLSAPEPRFGGAFLLAPQAGYVILIYDARGAELDMEDRHGDRKIQAAPVRRDSDQA